MKKLIGNVTPEEKEEILHLYERRNGLNELAKIVTADNDELYEKLVKDLGETGSRFQTWWTVWLPSMNGKASKAVIGRLILIHVRYF